MVWSLTRQGFAMREVNEIRALRDDLQARLDGLRGYL